MKSLFKATVVATSLAMTLGMSQAYADTAPKKEEVKLNSAFKTASQRWVRHWAVTWKMP